MREGVHPPPTPGWADFTIMLEFTPENGPSPLCILCGVSVVGGGGEGERGESNVSSPPVSVRSANKPPTYNFEGKLAKKYFYKRVFKLNFAIINRYVYPVNTK
jgi:hypothetical protein